jgi:ComF family protein
MHTDSFSLKTNQLAIMCEQRAVFNSPGSVTPKLYLYSCIIMQFCPICLNYRHAKQQLCSDCLALLPQHTPLQYFKKGVACYSPFLYEGLVQHLLKKLKFNERLTYSRVLGELLQPYLIQHYQDALPELLIPVPLHKKRLRERGFNQAVQIAQFATKRINIPINKTALQRIKHTKPQAQSTKRERQQQVSNAFNLKRNIDSTHVILLDDVITTGSTVLACYEQLKKHGIHKVDIWSVAVAK